MVRLSARAAWSWRSAFWSACWRVTDGVVVVIGLVVVVVVVDGLVVGVGLGIS